MLVDVLGSLGILALAALGGGPADPLPEGAACSMLATLAEEPEAPAMSAWAAPAPRPDWCTERDNMADPRCSPEGQGHPFGAPASSAVHRLDHPAQAGSVPDVAPLVQAAAPPWARLQGPGRPWSTRLLRPPRAPAGA